ncbi:hypothetical protein [Limnobacter sp.]|uniref:hypothetical protein n=1 Tax=Limnobacter sp. TaxID=2003368 RepID=UPI00311D55A5
MATVIKLKRGTTTPTTSDIVSGEVAIDTSAQKLYINDSGTVKEIGGGTASNSFTTINLNDSTNVVADSSSDTLNLDSTGLISITGNATTDTITVGTVSSATIPFLKADGSSSDIDLYTSGTIGQVITNLYIPFTIADGTAQTSLVVGSS